MMNWLRENRLSARQSVVLCAGSLAFLLMLSFFWLSTSTRTALLNAEIADLDGKRLALEDGINKHWRELGDVSAPGPMAARADKLGFAAVPVEYLIVEPLTVTVPVTASVTGPVAQ